MTGESNCPLQGVSSARNGDLHKVQLLSHSLLMLLQTPHSLERASVMASSPECNAAVQRAVKAGLVTSGDVNNIVADRISLAELLSQHDASQLFANPVEVIAFSDEEGVRYRICP